MSITKMQQGKRTRRKPIKACLECNRRKQKCNRQSPCNHCVSRGVEHMCVYSNFHPKSPGRGRSMYQRDRRSSSAAEHSRAGDSPSGTSSDGSESIDLAFENVESVGYPPAPSSQTVSSHSNLTLSSPDIGLKELTLASSRSPSRLQGMWPERPVADYLVGLFLQEINRIYEIIHPLSFKQRYAAWWATQEHMDTFVDAALPEEDVDFGILILRLCLLGMQCLPHSRYPPADILKVDLDHLEEWLLFTANEVEKSQPQVKKASIITVQHRFYHVCYLKNYAKIRDSWSVLNVAIKEAHEVGLHLKDPGFPLSELDLEIRRRTFWNLYVWDRFMCTCFGHWPLIPEGYFDIDPPHDNLDPLTLAPYAFTPFSDRVFHIKLARFQTAFMSPPSWKADQTDPITVAEFAQRFQEVIVDQLPPPYWLDNPDTSWDAVEPSIVHKRANLHFQIHSTRAALFRAFVDPCHSLRVDRNPGTSHAANLLGLSHRRTLMDSGCKVLASITQLYKLTADEEGGTAERLFMLPVNLVEELACLGVCLLSIQADERKLAKKSVLISPDLNLQYSYATFFDGYDMLCHQAPQYGIARRGVSILDNVQGNLRHSFSRRDLLDANSALALSPTAGPCSFHLEHALASLHGSGEEVQGRDPPLPLPGWLPSFVKSHSRSWLFHDGAAFGDLL